MKKISIILGILFSITSVFAQRYMGSEADRIIKDSKLVTLDENTGAVKHICFETAGEGQQFTNDFKEFLKRKLNLRPEYDLIKINTTDDLFGSNTKFQFTYNGIPIDGFIYGVQTKGNKVLSAHGYYIDARENKTFSAVSLSEEEALERALSFVNAKKYQWEIDVNFTLPTSKLYYLEKSGELVLVYQFDIYSAEPLSRQYIYINAVTGEIEKTTERIHIYSNDSGTAVTKYQGTKTITTDFNGGTYRLRENLRGNGIETYDLNNGTSYGSAVDFTDADNYWNTTTNQDNAAYDAHFGSEATYDYFFNNFGRNSIDGAGFALKSYVHYDVGYANAYWNGSCMTYGDGDGSSYTALTSIDIVAHEITHGLTSYTADLNYSYESGALNESFSDIFGTAVDFYANPTTANYLMGDQISVSGTPFRSMINPNLYGQPDTYLGDYWYTGSGDNGGVHYNSGVQNYWFYLLCVGGSGTNDNGDAFIVDQIGMDKAAAIAYKTLTVYLTPTSQYADARYYSIQSAIDMYGECSPEVINVTNAWYAVGVGAAYSNAVVANFRVSQNYFCTYPATVQFTNRSINATTYLWDFGDGASSTLLNPEHTYNSVGNYTVTLISTGVSACSSTDTLVSQDAIIVTEAGGPESATCSPTTVDPAGEYGIISFTFNGIYNNTSGSSDSYRDYTCNFSSTLTEGLSYNYSISIGTSNSSIIKMWIDLNNDGQFNNTNELLVDALNNTTTKTGLINIPHPTIYNTPLRLRIASDMNSGSNLADACTNSQYGQYEDYSVIIQQNSLPPIAKFSASGTTINLGQSVSFTDSSLNLPTSWVWTFDGGTPSTSTAQNPVITYNTLGTYPVKLKVQNSYGSDSLEITSFINVVNTYTLCSSTSTNATAGILFDSGGPTGDYQDNENCSFLIDPGCATSITLTFSSFNLESGWDNLYVYDGANSSGTRLLSATGTSLPPSVTAFSGKMFISIDTDGSIVYSGFEASWTSVIPEGIPSVDFLIDDENPPLNAEVQFTDQSTNTPNTWLWDFGDGTTSTEQNPTHIFTASGLKTVSLLATNCIGTGNSGKNLVVQGAPEINLNPSSFSGVINSCDDSISSTLIIKNTGEGSLSWRWPGTDTNVSDDFDSGIDNSVWQSITGGIAANACGSNSEPNALYFNHSSVREAITNPINAVSGGNINFYLKISNGTAPCETADSGEDVVLSYSTNEGSTWEIIQTYLTGSYNAFTPISEIIPVGAKTNATLFKWSQPSNSGTGFDNWSIDDVSVIPESNPFYSLTPQSGIITPGDSIEVTVEMKSSGISSGHYSDSIIINSNDPLTPLHYVDCELTVTGDPEMALFDTSINFGELFIGLTQTDTLLIFNSGCDTLRISNISSSLSEFTVDETDFEVLPFDSVIVSISFAPLSIGSFNGELTIYSNDTDTILSLLGVGIAPPVIAVSTDSIDENLNAGETSERILTITNSGSADLKYAIAIEQDNGNSHAATTGIVPDARIGFYADETRTSPGSELEFISKEINEQSQPQLIAGEILGAYGNFPENFGMVWANKKLYFADYWNNSLYVFDTLSLFVTESYPIHNQPFSIAFDGNYLWIGSSVGNVYGYDLSGNLVGSFSCPNANLHAITFDGTYFVVNTIFQSNPTFYRIDYDGAIIESFASSSGLYAFSTTWVPQHSNGNLWINDYENGKINQIDLSEGTANVVSAFDFSDNTDSYSLAHDGTNLWYADADGPLYKIDDGIVEIQWITVTPLADTITSGNSGNSTVLIDASKLYDGNYTATISIKSNDPATPVKTIPVELTVTGEADIDLSESSIDFGPIFSGTTKTDTITIFNIGTKTLNIGSITTDNPVFEVIDSSFSIAPGKNSALIISFSPDSVCLEEGILTITSSDLNDSIITVTLNGEGVMPPVISVSPDAINARITACNDSITLPLKIYNTGGSDLTFEIQGNSDKTVELLALTYGVDYGQEFQNTISAINQYFTDYNLTEINTTDPTALQTALSGKDVLLIPEQETGSSSVFTGFASVLQSFVNNGGTVIFCGMSNSECVTNTGLFSGSYIFNTDGILNVLNAAHPITDQVSASFTASNATYFYEITNTDAIRLVDYSNFDVVTYREIGKGRAIYIAFDYYAFDDNAAHIIANSVKWAGMGSLPLWMEINAFTGTISSGDSINIGIEFNSTGLSSGLYTDSIDINTNDPLNPTMRVACSLNYMGVPEMALSDTFLNFGESFPGVTETDTLFIINSGCDTLEVTNISSSLSEFSVDKSFLNIIPGDTGIVQIAFTPSSIDIYNGILSFQTNDPNYPDVEIDLTGECFLPPIIEVSADSINALVMAGDSVTHSITIQNNGSSNLYIWVEKLFSQGFGTTPMIENSINSFQLPNSYTNTEYKPNAAVSPVLSPVQKAFYSEIQNALFDSTIIFSDDFEQGDKGWTHYATSNADAWNFNSSRSASGLYSWNVAQHSGTGSDALQSPVIDLTACGDALLSFNHWYNFDDCNDPTFNPDGGIVELSTDNGVNWIQIQPIGGYQYLINSDCTPFFGDSVYSYDGGDGNDFIPAYFDLSSFAGNEIIIRFHAGWDCGNCASNEGWYIDDVAIYSQEVLTWLTFEPQSDTIPAGSSAVVSVKLNAKDLNEGVYNANLFISSNDPLTSEVTIPVRLIVDGEPEISVSDSLLVFDETSIGLTNKDTLTISNSGTSLLTISSIETDNPFFTVSDTVYSIEPGESKPIIVSFSPDSAKMYTGNLTINSDAISTSSIRIFLEGAGFVNQDSLALVALYNATDGDNWNNKTNWLNGPLNTWFGVTVVDERVTRLTLTWNNLSGYLPAEIGDLTALTTLNLGGNYNVTGEIPAEIGNLSNLSVLNLYYNLYTGTIPAEICNLTNLTQLDLSSCYDLSGTIPSAIGNLINLNILRLYGIGLDGSIPAGLLTLENLTYLELSENFSPAPMPDFSTLINLKTLYVNNCNFTGTIPSSLLQMSQLTNLGISNNGFTPAPIPDFSLLVNLIFLNANGCNFTGTIPETICQLSNLQDLYLSFNQLSGSIPASIENLSNLRVLSFDNNQFSGSIPTEIGNLTNLNYCYLYSNQLTGTIPASIGNLTNLYSLYLDNNQLSGSIPSEIGNLTNLNSCALRNNQLTGTIPSCIANLSNLSYLNLGDNHLTGSIPAEFGNLQNLFQFNINNNWLSGNLPSSLSNIMDNIILASTQPAESLPDENIAGYTNYPLYNVEGKLISNSPEKALDNLYSLDIRNNKFTFANIETSGIVPGSISYFYYAPQDTVLGLSYIPENSLTVNDGKAQNTNYQWYYNVELLAGETNDTITNIEETGGYYCSVTNTTYPDLVLTSEIYGTIDYNLATDSLSLVAFYNATQGNNWFNNSNWLTGPLNTWYGVTISGDRVTQLNLQSNNLQGYLPAEIGNLTALTSLDISSNYGITGNIPTEIGNLINITELDFWNINFYGEIPSNLWNLTNLTTLNLGACWNLEGTFPTEIGNLVNLNQLNLIGIGLTGSIPSSIGNLALLRVLDLGSNNLSGAIPSEIGNLSNLDFCSLNNNQLTGSLPASMGNMSSLVHLYLNNNSLSGNIPTEFGNLSNLEFCHLSNNQLSGDLPASFSSIFNNKNAARTNKTEPINTYLSDNSISRPTIGPDGQTFVDQSLNLLDNLISLQVLNNKFTFTNLQASGVTPGSIGDFRYAPQDTTLGLSFIPDQSLTVNDGKADNSNYQWYYCSKLLIGETNDTLVDINPTGDYYCLVTNTTYPDLQLTSEVYGIPGQGFILSQDTVIVAAIEGSTVSLSISSQIEWTATPNEAWMSVNPETRTGSGSIAVICTANIGEERTGTITISSPGYHDLTLTVIQHSALEVNPTTVTLTEFEGSSATISVTASVDWTASSDQSWLSVSPDMGSDNGTITLTASKNRGPVRIATVTVSSPGFEDRIITVTQATYANIYVLFTPTSPVIDGVEEAIWNTIAPIPISKNFQTETPTVTAYWKAMWTDNGLYVLMNVQDNDHYPSWEAGGATYFYDNTEIYFDVNEMRLDGRGPGYYGTGHYQSSPGFNEWGYDIPVIGSAPTLNSAGGDFAYHLDGENYVYEQFFPFGNFYTGENVQMDKDAFTSRSIGFDITIIDQDEGITPSRQRAVWMNDGNVDVLDESWNNMDDAGTIRLVEEIFNVAPVANAGNDQWVTETVKVHLNGSASSDTDGDVLSYLWTAPAGITLSSNTAAQPTFFAPSVTSPQTYSFTLVVNDGIVNSMTDTVIIHVMDALPSTHFETVWTGDAVDQMNINVVSVNIDSIEMEPGDEIGVFDGDLCVGVGVYPGFPDKPNIAWLGNNIRADSLYFAELTEAGYNVVDKTAVKGDLTLSQIADLDTFDLVILSRSMNSGDYNYPEKYDAIQAPLLCMSNIAARYPRLRYFSLPNIDDESKQDVMSAIDLAHPIFNNLTLSGSNTIDIANPGNYLKPLMDQQSAGNGNLIGVTSIDSLVLIAEWDAKQPYYEGSIDTLHGKRMVYFNTLGSNIAGQSESFLSNNGYQLLKNIAEYMITGHVATTHTFSSAQGNVPDIQNLNILPIVVSADDGSGNGYTPGHTLTFRLYDSSRDIEIDNVAALYLDDDPSWSTDGLFSAGATSFVELTGSVVPQNLTVTSRTLSNGVIDCFDAHDTIIVAGGGTTVLLESNSTATFIAGASIRFLPGFNAESGSNMDAHITTIGAFCDLYEPLIVEAPVAEAIVVEKSTIEPDEPGKNNLGASKMLKVYPNPNNGNFTLELLNIESGATVCIYNMLGATVYKSSTTNEGGYKINLLGIKKGIYFVKVMDGKEQITKKMVVN